MGETAIQKAVMLAIGSQPNTRIFRNNCGVAHHKDGSRVVYGLCPGSSDLIGWRTITITADMVGHKFAQFTAIEVKTATGRISQQQDNFIRVINSAGGLAAVIRSPAEAAAMFAEVTP